MIDNFKFNNENNRVRLVGTIVSCPEPYFKANNFRFYIDARIKPEEPNIVPVVCGPHFISNHSDDLIVGNRVAIFGKLNATAYMKLDESGVEMKIFEEFVRANEMICTDKEYSFPNVGIFKGKLVKQPQLYHFKNGRDLFQGVLKLGDRHSVTIGVTFSEAQMKRLQNFEQGDDLAIKFRLKTTKTVHQKTRIQPYLIFEKGDDLQKNPYFLDLDTNPPRHLDR